MSSGGTEIAKITWFNGNVRVIRNNREIDAYVGMPLELLDTLKAFSGGTAEIEFPGVGHIQLISNKFDTRIQIQNPLIHIDFGEILFKIKASLPWRTKYVAGDTVGTVFSVTAYTAEGDDIVHVKVMDGMVEVSSTTGAWNPVVVGVDTVATIKSTQPPQINPIIE
jgi:hypothetical protein